jgi:tryptophan synthase beta chain
MDWGLTLSQMEGIIPAIETAHAFAILDVRKFLRDEVIVFNCSGRGDKDLDTYIDYFKL